MWNHSDTSDYNLDLCLLFIQIFRFNKRKGFLMLHITNGIQCADVGLLQIETCISGWSSLFHIEVMNIKTLVACKMDRL